MTELSLIIAFTAGILSFLSPCILPILPGFIAYLSSTSGEKQNTRLDSFLNSFFFVLGFSLVFSILGILLNSVLGSTSYAIRVWLGRIGGAAIIIFALHILGLLKIPFLMGEHKLEVKKRFKITYITSFLFGVSFAAGWTPCVGAILGSVLSLAVSEPARSFALLMAYSLGLGIPFLLSGIFTAELMMLIRKSGTFMKYFNIVVGTLLILLGILVFTDNLGLAANFLIPSRLFR